MRSRLIYHKRNVFMCCKLSAGDFGVLRMSFQTMKTWTILESWINLCTLNVILYKNTKMLSLFSFYKC